MKWSTHGSVGWIEERHDFSGNPKAGAVALRATIRESRRNLRHARSLASGKRNGEKCSRIGESAIAAAIKWHGHEAVCHAIKRAKDSHAAEKAIAKLYAKSGKSAA